MATRTRSGDNPAIHDSVKRTFLANLPDSIGNALRGIALEKPMNYLIKAANEAIVYGSQYTPNPAVMNVSNPTQNESILFKKFENLEEVLRAMAENLKKSQSNGGNPRSRKRVAKLNQDGLCFYHARFGDKARRCQLPSSCKFEKPKDFLEK